MPSSGNLDPQTSGAIAALLLRGEKIAAIKACREATGLGLAEAKEAVEALERGLGGAKPPAAPDGTLTPQVRAEIEAQLRQGNKITAIKIHRDATGYGLADAKRAVEDVERGLGAAPPDSAPASAASLTPQTIQEIETLLFHGQKIAAIQVYREATRCGLAEAKAMVEDLERDLRARRPEKFRSGVNAAALAAAGALALILLAGIAALAVIRR